MKKRNVFLVMLLCVVMVFTSCGTGGTAGTSQLPAAADSGSAKEVTVDDSDVKLDTQIVTGDPSQPIAVGSDETTGKDESAENTAGTTTEKAASTSSEKAGTAKTQQTKDETAKVETTSADKTAADSIIETLIEEKHKASDKTEVSNISAAAESENYDANGDPSKPYDEINPEVFEDEDVKYADNAILIKFNKSFKGKLTSDLKKAGIGKLEFIFGGADYAWYTGYILKKADLAETMENVRGMENVITAEYNFVSEATADDSAQVALTQNPKAGDQWVLNSCGIKEAWTFLEEKGISAGGSSGVVVAVIDTGVDYTHEDLKANMWVNTGETSNNSKDDDGNGYVDDYYGVDITAGKGSAMDDEGHGTHVAGIIAAANNKTGMIGIAYNTKIMAIKAGDASGYFLQNNVAKAIMYAYENGADVINMSFGGSESSIAVKDALETAYGRCVLVASAGNSGYPNEATDYYFPSPNYPAAFSFVLGVMSAGQDKTESAFSNWDATLFNTVEYEVYAPGEQILSTLPGDRYAKLSGTSMAAPVVAAEAALLRSYYSDTSRYPTKYIYGQIVGGTDESVKCANPKNHTINGITHNLPGTINFEKAFTYVPKPDIGISDYTLFDTQGFTADTEGLTAGCESVNNGDGILDAGETIALGFTLRNRWGMSKNTKVHIDADSSTAGIEHPYVDFLNNDLDYGSIGTYSGSDSGKLYTGDVWTGWQNPFYVKVSKDCPNEYTIRLNITVTYENGLDDTDTTVYKSSGTALFIVRRGIELPNRIENDMTLTKDNYYIIPNATTIAEGATVTVEPGTKIQFWCSDPKDAYADTAIAYLKVEGKFICNGTDEEPIELFPSAWMDKYAVQIYESNDGYVELDYTSVTNPYFLDQRGSGGITTAEHCEFKQNYKGRVYSRTIFSEGSVGTTGMMPAIKADKVSESAFYKMGGGPGYSPTVVSPSGKYIRCIFVDSAIGFSNQDFTQCVLYGNNNYDDGTYGAESTFRLTKNQDSFNIESTVLYDYSEGKLYLTGTGLTSEIVKQYFEQKKIKYAVIKTQAELMKLFARLNPETKYYLDDVIIDGNGEARYASGEKISDDIINEKKKVGRYYAYIYKQKIYLTDTAYRQSNDKELFEAEIPIYVTDISLDEYLIDLDMEAVYQINAEVFPENANPATLNYKSENSEIAKVSEDGVIIPTGLGTTRIKVYSSDDAIYNYITVNVRSKIVPEKISFAERSISLQVGRHVLQKAKMTPAYATEREVSYTSSNEEVATVQKNGTITAIAPGKTVITAAGYNGITAELEVNCYNAPEKITFPNKIYVTAMNQNDGRDFYPRIYPENAAYDDLEWEVADKDICYVDKNGELVKNSTGTTDLRVHIKGTNLYATTKIAVTENRISTNIKKIWMTGNIGPYVLKKDGEFGEVRSNGIYERINFNNGKTIKDVIVKKDDVNQLYYYVLYEDSTVQRYKFNAYLDESFALSDVAFFSENSRTTAERSIFAVTKNGFILAWGENTYGQLGIDISSAWISEPTLVEIESETPIKKILSFGYASSATLFLNESGDLYLCGTRTYKYSEPQLIQQNVKDIYPDQAAPTDDDRGSQYAWVIGHDGTQYKISGESGYMQEYLKEHDGEQHSIQHDVYIEDGRVYIKGNNTYGQLGIGKIGENVNEYVGIPDIENAVKVFDLGECIYVQTADGNLYGMGEGRKLPNGDTEKISVPTLCYFGITGMDKKLALEEWNHDEVRGACNTSPDAKIILDYNWEIGTRINTVSMTDSAGIRQIAKVTKDFDKIVIEPKVELKKGEIYTIKRDSASDLLAFTYDGQPILSGWNHTEETLESSESEQAETINVVTDEILTLDYDVKIFEKSGLDQIVMKDSSGRAVAIETTIAGGQQLQICPTLPFTIGETYTLTVPAGALVSRFDVPNEETVLTFTYKGELEKKQWNLTGSAETGMALYDNRIQLTYNGTLSAGEAYDKISVTTVEKKTVTDSDGNETEVEETVPCSLDIQLDEKDLILTPTADGTFEEGRSYTLSVPENALKDVYGRGNAKEIQQTFVFYRKPALEEWNKDDTQEGQEKNLLSEGKLILKFAQQLTAAAEEKKALLVENDDAAISTEMTIAGDTITIIPKEALYIGREYTLTVPAGICQNEFGAPNKEITLTFTYNGSMECIGGNYTAGIAGNVVKSDAIVLNFNGTLGSVDTSKIKLQTVTYTETTTQPQTDVEVTEGTDIEGETEKTESVITEMMTDCGFAATTEGNTLTIAPTEGFAEGTRYVLTLESETLIGMTEGVELKFAYEKPEEPQGTDEPDEGGDASGTTGGESTGDGTVVPENEPAIPEDSAYDVVNPVVEDPEKMAERTYLTKEDIEADWAQYVKDGLNTTFKGNAILNRLIDDDVSKWLRITAPSSSTYQKIGLGGNYWGTTSQFLINKQILDYDDYQDLADINEGKYLTEAPKDTWPFVVDAYVKVEGETVDTVGNQDVTFVVDFNRDMDTSIPLNVAFGSSYPYNDYEVGGEYKTPTHWEGTVTLNTLIENGYQRWSISNGKAAGTSMKLYKDWGRFQFKIDTTAAQALIMQAEATATGIQLSWTQDEFDTLAGYNVYRSTAEDGLYTKLNKTIIAADTRKWFDDTVLPGEQYYYNFTVVESDMSESEPSGKITIRAFDTMAPDIYHSPVTSAFTGSKLMISAKVTDNVDVATVTLYYRTTGTETWKPLPMLRSNDKYSAAIGIDDITTAGIEYYIDACDAQNNHTYEGTAEEPYAVTVQQAIESSSMGDVDGDGAITVKDAMMILMAVSDRLNLTEEQFKRANLDNTTELSTLYALRIIKYVNGTLTSLV